MSNDLVPYQGTSLTVRDSRRTDRAISRHHASALTRISGTDAEADVTQAKIDNYTMATGAAMTSVVRIAMAQRQLEQLAPEAAGRLEYLAGDHLLGMGDVLADLRRAMRRW